MIMLMNIFKHSETFGHLVIYILWKLILKEVAFCIFCKGDIIFNVSKCMKCT